MQRRGDIAHKCHKKSGGGGGDVWSMRQSTPPPGGGGRLSEMFFVLTCHEQPCILSLSSMSNYVLLQKDFIHSHSWIDRFNPKNGAPFNKTSVKITRTRVVTTTENKCIKLENLFGV